MKTNSSTIATYDSPEIEVILVEVEKGFATSTDFQGEIDEMPWG